MSEIGERRRKLDKARRIYMEEVMRGYDVGYRIDIKKLQEECGTSESGHNYRFSNFGPLGHPWYFCSICGISKVGGIDE
jgi:hypothetical protein